MELIAQTNFKFQKAQDQTRKLEYYKNVSAKFNIFRVRLQDKPLTESNYDELSVYVYLWAEFPKMIGEYYGAGCNFNILFNQNQWVMMHEIYWFDHGPDSFFENESRYNSIDELNRKGLEFVETSIAKYIEVIEKFKSDNIIFKYD